MRRACGPSTSTAALKGQVGVKALRTSDAVRLAPFPIGGHSYRISLPDLSNFQYCNKSRHFARR